MLSPYYKYKYDHPYRTCVSVKYLILTFPLRFLSVATFQVAFYCSQQLGVRLCHIKVLVCVINPMCNTGLNIGQPGMHPVFSTGHFQLSCYISSSYVFKKKKSQLLTTAYQPVCLSIISTMLQVNDDILYLYVCTVCMCHLRSLFFVIYWSIYLFFEAPYLWYSIHLFCIVFLFVTQYCFAWSGDWCFISVQIKVNKDVVPSFHWFTTWDSCWWLCLLIKFALLVRAYTSVANNKNTHLSLTYSIIGCSATRLLALGLMFCVRNCILMQLLSVFCFNI